MPTFLSLGNITFANYEIPEYMPFGGKQSLAVHKLLGGQRVVQAMGRDDDDYSWEGIFFGTTAQFRARYLDGLRINGGALKLTYAQFNYSVVISAFEGKFERINQVPYRITVTVVQDLNAPFSILLPVSYNDAVQNLLIEATNLANALANPNITNSLAILGFTINQVGNLDNAASSALATITGPLKSCESAVASAISSTNGALFP